MTISVTGTIMPGQGNAARNHRALIPRVAARFPEVANCSQFGTINVFLDEPLDRSRADFWTPQVAWIPAFLPAAESAYRLEAFGFIRIEFECPIGGPAYTAWIILPEGSDLTYAGDRAEIIADVFVPAVAYGTRCAIRIDHIPAIEPPSWFGETYGKSLKVKWASAKL
jgi:hypothetical protein